MINKKIALRSAIVAASILPTVAMASGYKINEQSAAGMGSAHAGRAAMAEDASVVFYNPAAMTELDRAQLSAGFTYINGDGEFTGNGTDAAGQPIRERMTLTHITMAVTSLVKSSFHFSTTRVH